MLEGDLRNGTFIAAFGQEAQFAHLLTQTLYVDLISLNVADRFDRANNLYGNDVEKNQVAAPRNVPIIDHGDSVSSNLLNVNPRSRLIALEGCYSSDASQLLNDRKFLLEPL